jgi:hypothetical protein
MTRLCGNFRLSSKPAFNVPIKVPYSDPNFPSISRKKLSDGLADGYLVFCLIAHILLTGFLSVEEMAFAR